MTRNLTALSLVAATFALSGCLIVPPDAVPSLLVEADVASQYNFRGMVNSEEDVLQLGVTAFLPTKAETGDIKLKTWGNIDLHNDNGDAWFPDGHGGEFTQIDFEIAYSDVFYDFDVQSGLVSYSLQNPDDFPLATERGETREVFFHASKLVNWDLLPFLRFHYDFDEVDGLYIIGGVSREFEIREDTFANAALSLGHVDDDQANWLYGTSLGEDGFADLRLTGEVQHAYDANTTFRASLNYSTMIDSDLSDWFDVIGIDPDNFWIALGVTWAAGG